MNRLESAVKNVLDLSGSTTEANAAYLEFIKANFIVPVDIKSKVNAPEVLFLTEKDNVFLPVFTSVSSLNQWAADIGSEINLLNLTGVNLLKGVGDNVTVCLNIGSPYYKEFNPQELARMRSMVLKLFKN